MNRSTPIGALRRDEESDPNIRDMVDGIVDELDPRMSMGYQEDMNGQIGAPQSMDYGGPDGGMYSQEFSGGNAAMLPPGDPRMGQQMPHQQMPQMQQMHPDDYQMQQMQQMQQMPQMQGMQGGHGQGPVSKGMIGNVTDMIVNNSREPMLAAVLFFIMSNDTVSSILSRYIPYASSPIIGMIIRSILVAILFFVGKTFIVKN